MRKIIIAINQFNFLITLFSFIGVLFVFFFGKFLPYLNVFSNQVLSVLLIFFVLSASSLFVRIRLFNVLVVFYLLISSYFSELRVDATYLLLFILLVQKKDFIFFGRLVKSIFQALLHLVYSFPAASFVCIAMGLTIFSYKLLFNSYFEGDEWYWMRVLHTAYAGSDWFYQIFSSSFHSRDITNPHMIPISDGYQLLQFHFFGLNYSYYVIASLIGHFANAVLVAIFTFLYYNSRKIAIAAGLLFVVLTTHSQAITWMAAVVNTQPALFFGLLSLIFSLQFAKTNKKRYFFGTLLSLLFSVLSKETAVIFLALSPVLYISEKKAKFPISFWHYFGFVFVILCFAAVQYGARFGGVSIFESSTQPWLYVFSQKIDAFDFPLIAFRYVIFFAKTIAQVVIPFSLISQLGYGVTELQFPYFWEEESIGGTKFLVFVQSVAPEFLSYLLAFLILLLLWITYQSTQYKRQMRILFFGMSIGIIPILLITLRFPWWGFTTAIDERHFYHLSFIMVIFFAIALDGISSFISRKIAINSRNTFILLLAFLLMGNMALTQEKILKQQKATSSEVRTSIVSTLQEEIAAPQKRMIIYVESDSSFYGFAELMLPFQTSFAHMLPVIFSQHMHQNGLHYPDIFYTDSFLQQSKGSLVSQGVYKNDGYLLGHYLNKISLLKYLRNNQEDVDIVYGFAFHSKSGEFSNITTELRSSIHDFFTQAEVFSNWKEWYLNEENILFQTNPEWQVEFSENFALVKNGNKALFKIESFANSKKQTFTEFVGEQSYQGLPIGTDYVTSVLEMKYDETTRPIYSPKKDLNIKYLYSGNNDFFYRISFYDPDISADILSLLQFRDTIMDTL